MSVEFWYGTLLSGALFVIGSIISVFSADIRRYYVTWQKNRTLRGAALRLSKLELDLSEHQRLANDYSAAAAFFWSGLFLLVAVLMLLGLSGFITYQLNGSVFRPLGAGAFVITWLMAYTIANSLHRRAEALRRPQMHTEQLSGKISALKAQLPESRA